MTKRKAKPDDIDPVFGTFARREQFMQKLQMLKIAQIHVDYAGESDSGSVNEVHFVDEHDDYLKAPPAVELEVTETNSQFDQATGQWVKHTSTAMKPITEAVEMIAYEVLSATGMDWINNDGGRGTIYIKVVGGALEVVCNMTVPNPEEHTFKF